MVYPPGRSQGASRGEHRSIRISELDESTLLCLTGLVAVMAGALCIGAVILVLRPGAAQWRFCDRRVALLLTSHHAPEVQRAGSLVADLNCEIAGRLPRAPWQAGSGALPPEFRRQLLTRAAWCHVPGAKLTPCEPSMRKARNAVSTGASRVTCYRLLATVSSHRRNAATRRSGRSGSSMGLSAMSEA